MKTYPTVRFARCLSVYRKLLALVSVTSVLFGCAMHHGPVSALPLKAPIGVCDCGAPWVTYLTFFSWSSAVLSPTARDTVAKVAAEEKEKGFSSIMVRGFTDSSGNSIYNLKLSQRRARVVADLLTADGVPEKWITIRAYGSTHLLIPTGPGVREGQNRRVEIIRDQPSPNP